MGCAAQAATADSWTQPDTVICVPHNDVLFRYNGDLAGLVETMRTTMTVTQRVTLLHHGASEEQLLFLALQAQHDLNTMLGKRIPQLERVHEYIIAEGSHISFIMVIYPDAPEPIEGEVTALVPSALRFYEARMDVNRVAFGLLLDAMRKGHAVCDIPFSCMLTGVQLQTIDKVLHYDYPELQRHCAVSSISVQTVGDCIIRVAFPCRSVSIMTMRHSMQVREQVAGELQRQTEGMTAFQKEKAVYDYLFNIFNASCDPTDAYARAFKYLCDCLAVKCICCGDGDRTWNRVHLDGSWYNTDIAGGGYKYHYFNVSDEYLGYNKPLYLDDISCTKTTHEYYRTIGQYVAQYDCPEQRISYIVAEQVRRICQEGVFEESVGIRFDRALQFDTKRYFTAQQHQVTQIEVVRTTGISFRLLGSFYSDDFLQMTILINNSATVTELRCHSPEDLTAQVASIIKTQNEAKRFTFIITISQEHVEAYQNVQAQLIKAALQELTLQEVAIDEWSVVRDNIILTVTKAERPVCTNLPSECEGINYDAKYQVSGMTLQQVKQTLDTLNDAKYQYRIYRQYITVQFTRE